MGIKLISGVVTNLAELHAYLSQPEFTMASAVAQSTLVQVYIDNPEHGWHVQLVEVLTARLPGAIVVGASSGGGIAQGRLARDSTVIATLFFTSTRLKAVALEGALGGEYALGQDLAQACADPELRAILLLAPPTRLDCALLLDGLQSGTAREVQIFGGGAAETRDGQAPRVLLQNQALSQGAVAVALSGPELYVEQHLQFSWKPLGPALTLTEVRGFQILSIDGRPATEVYRRYLRIEPDDDDIYLLEFPLIVERDSLPFARNPVALSQDGSVRLVASVRQGEVARLGYLDIDDAVANVGRLRERLAAFGPQAILLFSCICRHFTLQQDVEFETRPFQAMANSAGFFTYGEFGRVGERAHLFNSSQVVVGLREGPARPMAAPLEPEPRNSTERIRFRHAYVTSRLFHSVSSLSEELDAANRKLRHFVDHDALTGVLNRYALDSQLDIELARSQRYGYELALLMLDLDHFKRLNDEFGHLFGDQVLKSFTQTVTGCMRASDSLYRYGGEEFVLVLPQTSMAHACTVAEKVRQWVADMRLPGEQAQGLRVTCSIGVAAYPGDGDSGRALLEAADQAMYRAKESGRNRVEWAGSGGMLC